MSLSAVTPRVRRPGQQVTSARLMDAQDSNRGDSVGTKRVNLSFRLPEDVASELAARSSELGINKTAYLILALQSYFGKEIK